MKSTNFKLKAPQHKKHKLLVIIVALIVGVSALYGVYAVVTNHRAENEKAAQKTKDEAQTNSAKQNAVSTDGDVSATTKTAPASPSATTSNQVPVSSQLTVGSPTFSQANHIVTVTTSVSGSTAQGTCVFTFTKEDEKPVIRQVVSASKDQSQYCTVGVPEVEFTRLGSWNLNATFYTTDSKGEANHEVTIN